MSKITVSYGDDVIHISAIARSAPDYNIADIDTRIPDCVTITDVINVLENNGFDVYDYEIATPCCANFSLERIEVL